MWVDEPARVIGAGDLKGGQPAVHRPAQNGIQALIGQVPREEPQAGVHPACRQGFLLPSKKGTFGARSPYVVNAWNSAVYKRSTFSGSGPW
jgi:hypothetical protein